MDFESLVKHVEAGGGDPLEQLRRASERSKEMATLADALLDHFIHKGRDAGLTWTQIGEALDISKQAAQQRSTRVVRAFTPSGVKRSVRAVADEGAPMFGRFTDKARKAVTEAQTLAAERNHPQIGTEHLLAGLFAVGGVGAQALADLGVSADAAAGAVGDPGSPDALAGAKPTFTPAAKQVLERSLREAVKLGHNYIGTEHIALGLLMLGEGSAHDLAAERGVHAKALRARIEAILAERRKPQSPDQQKDQP